MPTKPARPCRQPGCPNKIPCPEHSSLARAYRRRGTRQQQGYGVVWQRLRKIQLRRHPLCRECERQGVVGVATEVDHIVPKERGGQDVFENLQSLCHRHHSEKTMRELNEACG